MKSFEDEIREGVGASRSAFGCLLLSAMEPELFYCCTSTLVLSKLNTVCRSHVTTQCSK